MYVIYIYIYIRNIYIYIYVYLCGMSYCADIAHLLSGVNGVVLVFLLFTLSIFSHF